MDKIFLKPQKQVYEYVQKVRKWKNEGARSKLHEVRKDSITFRRKTFCNIFFNQVSMEKFNQN